MPGIYEKHFHINAAAVDRFDRLRPSYILSLLQDVAGDHSDALGADKELLMQRNLFWAVIRHRVSITRLPKAGEDVTVKTWPMPTTRTAYPRSTVIYDSQGQELMRSISLWVLMERDTRSMVLPGKSGVVVNGHLEGSELAPPGSLILKPLGNSEVRCVRFTDLDWNGHMNNCRYLDWVADLLPSRFHEHHPVRDLTVCYLSEAREGEKIRLSWELQEDGSLRMDGQRENVDLSTAHSRVFSVQMLF